MQVCSLEAARAAARLPPALAATVGPHLNAFAHTLRGPHELLLRGELGSVALSAIFALAVLLHVALAIALAALVALALLAVLDALLGFALPLRRWLLQHGRWSLHGPGGLVLLLIVAKACRWFFHDVLVVL